MVNNKRKRGQLRKVSGMSRLKANITKTRIIVIKAEQTPPRAENLSSSALQTTLTTFKIVSSLESGFTKI